MDARNIARSLGNWSWSCYQKSQALFILLRAAGFMPFLLLFMFFGFSFQKWESGPLAGSRSEAQLWYHRHGCGVEVVGLSGAHWLALQGGRQTSRCVYVIGIQQILAKKWINECHLREINLSAACKVGWKAETLELGRTIRGLLHNLRMQILGPTEGKWCWGQKKWREKSESVEEDI